MSKKFNNVENIIKFYIENIENITYIYSEKIFYIFYPNFNIEYYKFFNKNIINLYINHKNDNNLFNLNILNNYHKSNKDNIICSLQSFYEKYNDFNLILYKSINKNLLNYEKDEDYIFNWCKNKDQIYSISTFLKVYNMLNLNIYKCYLKYILKLQGSNRVCLGSDYPFPLGDLEIGKFIEESDLSSIDKANIFHNSTLEWLNLDKKAF
jgi:hypothetical protein